YGVIKDNDIFQNMLAGLYIDDESSPEVTKNRICNGLGTGITVSDGGMGKIEDNDIFLNKLSGLEVSKGGNPEAVTTDRLASASA
ncbi:hypothetical protein T484DRAFT_1790200, partial [Baffinella frigidus]